MLTTQAAAGILFSDDLFGKTVVSSHPPGKRKERISNHDIDEPVKY